MEKVLGAFDFDYTIIEDNSDFVVRDLLPPEIVKERLENFKHSEGWTTYMQETFNLLYEEGITEDKIKEAITSIRAVPDFISLFKILQRKNCEIIIISDSNTYFIEEWLKKNGIREAVHTIYSNPGYFSEGKLYIEKFHEQDWCNLSTRNLCKGYILESHIRKRTEEGIHFKRIFYVGDGHNDLCPSMKLSLNDVVFPRIGFPLVERLRFLGSTIKTRVMPWEDTNQILSLVETLL